MPVALLESDLLSRLRCLLPRGFRRAGKLLFQREIHISASVYVFLSKRRCEREIAVMELRLAEKFICGLLILLSCVIFSRSRGLIRFSEASSP